MFFPATPPPPPHILRAQGNGADGEEVETVHETVLSKRLAKKEDGKRVMVGSKKYLCVCVLIDEGNFS